MTADKPIKIAVIPDTQVKPDQDLSYLGAIGNYIVEKQPDAVVHLGDFADLPSLSSYDKNKKSFEGRRYKKDVEAAKEGMDLLLSPMRAYNNQHSRNKKKTYNPYMLMLYGNHECFDGKTEVLTRSGWRLIKDVEEGESVLTLDENNCSEWQVPYAKVEKPYNGELCVYSSRTVDMAVTPNHRVFWESSAGNRVWSTANDAAIHCDLLVSGKSTAPGVALNDAELRFVAVACTDSSHSGDRVVFYQSEGKHRHIEQIIQEAGVNYTVSKRDRGITHICGKKLKSRAKTSYEFHMRRPDWCWTSNRRLPQYVYNMTTHQFSVFLDTLVFCDGTIPKSAQKCAVFYGRKEICEDVQAACVFHGYRATLTEYRPDQWRVNIVRTNLCRSNQWLVNREHYDGTVYCLSVNNGTLLTRRNGKPVFTGNCRISRAVEDDPKLDGTIGLRDLGYEEAGWEVSPFLKVEQVAGICFSHYFVSGVMGRPITSAQALLTKKHVSCIAGHQQGKQIATATRGDGKRITGIITGSCYPHSEEYLGPQGNEHWRGMLMCYEAIEGQFDEGFISLDYLMRRYS